jgi:hypothetical protein
MRTLGRHYRRARSTWNEAELLLLVDIDGTILDMRHMVAFVLRAYDEAHGTRHFASLRPTSIVCHENDIDVLLDTVPSVSERARVRAYYLAERWSRRTLHEGHRAFEGVLDVLAWFQRQPRTSVALVTGRPNALRTDTSEGFRRVAEAAGVIVPDALLFMNPRDWEQGVQATKADALAHFRRMGYRPFAFIDNEPVNLEAVGAADAAGEVLLLHADTVYESQRGDRVLASGSRFILDELLAGVGSG